MRSACAPGLPGPPSRRPARGRVVVPLQQRAQPLRCYTSVMSRTDVVLTTFSRGRRRAARWDSPPYAALFPHATLDLFAVTITGSPFDGVIVTARRTGFTLSVASRISTLGISAASTIFIS